MATFADMLQTDPNLRLEYDVWRPLREQNGEDPVDWDAFRTHVTAIGHPDPGPVASSAMETGLQRGLQLFLHISRTPRP